MYYLSAEKSYTDYLIEASMSKDVVNAIDRLKTETNVQLSNISGKLTAQNDYNSNLNAINDTINKFHSDFNYGMGIVIGQIQVLSDILGDVLVTLDKIHQTLQSPTLTQAREHYKIGCHQMSIGLYDKALEAFHRAEEKYDADPLTHQHIGMLYLYGANEEISVVDPVRAKYHLLQSVRYAKAESVNNATLKALAAQNLLHSSIAVYVWIGDNKNKFSKQEIMGNLGEAEKYVEQAIQLNPNFHEAHYHLAKYQILSEKKELSLKTIYDFLS